MYGTFYIDGMWVEGTITASQIIPNVGFYLVLPPWEFVGHNSNGDPIRIGSNTKSAIIVIASPLVLNDALQAEIDAGAKIILGHMLNTPLKDFKKKNDNTVNSDLENELNITYNSTNEEIQIISPAKQIDIVVSDLNGKNVYSIKNSNTTTISTKNLPQAEGAYILKITSNGQTATKKIILSNGKCYFSSEK